MSILDIFTILGLILSSIVAILTIIASFMKIKWKALFPRFRLKVQLKKYIKIRSNEEEETKNAKEIVSLLFKARKQFEYKDFIYDVRPTRHGNIVVKDLYKIHLTPPSGPHHQQFKISRINNPNEGYYSEGYPAAQKENNNITVLEDLISDI